MFLTGVIGYPLKQTYSPLLHNTAFYRLGINGMYYPMCVQPGGFEAIIPVLKKLKFTGVNITNPYKRAVLKYLDDIDSLTISIGAVNTVVIEEGRSIGFNTDFYGFKSSLAEHKIVIKNKSVLLVGAGGVVRACAYLLKDSQPKKIFIANRTISRAQEIAEICNAEAIAFEQIIEVIKYTNIVINGTSIDLQEMIIPWLNDGSIYYDINYGFKPLKHEGIFLVNGLSMLIYQAALSFSLWTKRKPPVAIMKSALKGGVG